MDLPILFETPHLSVINKPNGLLVERDRHGYPSVEEWAQERWPFVGIVHRLDRPVSGVLLLARKKSALKDLNRQFEARTVGKTYLAIVENPLPHLEGILEHWLVKDQKGKRSMVAEPGAKGAFFCSLGFRTLQALPSGLTLLEIKPHSGKFHQIRVQLAASGCPIAGDEKYGASLPYQPDGIALHAWQLLFNEPPEGKPLLVKAPCPEHSLWRRFDYLHG